MMGHSTRTDDRGVSTAVNHILAIGITTILISGLLIAAGSVLDDQEESATRQQLQTVAERLASQIENTERVADKNGGTLVVRTSHPQTSVGDSYTMSLEKNCGSDPVCLRLSPAGAGPTAEVPVDVEQSHVTVSSVTGGNVYIVYEDGELTLAQPSADPALGTGISPPQGGSTYRHPIPGYGFKGVSSSGGGGGGGGGGSAPSIDTFTITDNGHPNHARYDVSWSVSDPDGDLNSVTVFVNSTTDGTIECSYSGTSGSKSCQGNGDDGDSYEIKIVAEDSNGNTACEKFTGVANGNSDETKTTC